MIYLSATSIHRLPSTWANDKRLSKYNQVNDRQKEPNLYVQSNIPSFISRQGLEGSED